MSLSLLGKAKAAFLALFIACLVFGLAGAPGCSTPSSETSDFTPTDPTEDFSDITWPTRGVATMLPQPSGLFGEITSDRSDHFGARIGNFTAEQFAAYIAACEETGFTENYSKSSESYVADNPEGYHLWLDYSPDHQYMSISLDAPDDAADPSSDDAGAAQDSSYSAEHEAADKTSDDNEAKQAEAEKPAEKSSDGNTVLGEVTPDCKKAMDEYEAFFDEYLAFMEKYEKSSDMSPEMLEDFTKYMDRYSQTMDALNDIDEDSLSPADYAYYTEVMLRINKKIASL